MCCRSKHESNLKLFTFYRNIITLSLLLWILWILSPNACSWRFIRLFCAFIAIYIANCIAKTSGQPYADRKAVYGRSFCVRILARTGTPYADVKGTTMLGPLFISLFACVIATLEASFIPILMRFAWLEPWYDREELTWSCAHRTQIQITFFSH